MLCVNSPKIARQKCLYSGHYGCCSTTEANNKHTCSLLCNDPPKPFSKKNYIWWQIFPVPNFEIISCNANQTKKTTACGGNVADLSSTGAGLNYQVSELWVVSSTFPSIGPSGIPAPGLGWGLAPGLLSISVFNTKRKGARMLPNVNLYPFFWQAS